MKFGVGVVDCAGVGVGATGVDGEAAPGVEEAGFCVMVTGGVVGSTWSARESPLVKMKSKKPRYSATPTERSATKTV